jgi:NADPH-dependent 2,4-dienoyl-CoA reductase/sulfur reductase-like enzyme
MSGSPSPDQNKMSDIYQNNMPGSPSPDEHNSIIDGSPRVAVIGAGVGGLVAVKTLQQRGIHSIDIFEKDVAVGGRVQTDVVSAQLEKVWTWTLNLHTRW